MARAAKAAPLAGPHLRSECGRYTARRWEGDTTRHRLFDAATGEPVCDTTFWSNEGTDTLIRFECGSGDVRAVFSYPRFPGWFHRRWVECWDIDCKELAGLVEQCGGTALVCYKPDMNCWNHLGFKGTPKVAKAVDRELGRRKLGFTAKPHKGGFGIECPTAAREADLEPVETA